MKKLFIISIVHLSFITAFSQNFWSASENKNIPAPAQITAHNANYLELDINNFTTHFFNAPLRVSHIQFSDVAVQIPLPNGEFEEYLVFESPIMQNGLAAKYPQVKTFILRSTENLENYGRADITPKGFHAMLFTKEGTLFIDPVYAVSNKDYISYYKKDFYSSKPISSCEFDEDEAILTQEVNDLTTIATDNEFIPQQTTKASNGLELKTYRLAMSATAEYTQYHGGTVVDGLAAIVTTMNRINGVYEREFAIKMILVDNNDLVVYTNAATDPFQNTNDPSQLLGENRNSLNNVIGEANYDIGHVVGRGGSGLAGFGVVCAEFNGFHKANGTTGISNPIGDPFDIDFVAHEIGHQFGASHTFNGTTGSCSGGNRSATSAYEPGSATTIMGYAGICAPQNIQNNSDDYFHNRNLNQVTNFINGNGSSCAVETATGNNIPVLSILTPENLTIPISTPFQLEASATDVNGDALTYCWEQYDRGNAGEPNTPVGNAPLFRSFSPTVNPIRTFPQISDILSGVATYGEILPDYTRDMNFKVTVRDNVPNGAAFIDDNIEVAVDAYSGPFVVTSQNTNVTWQSGNSYTVTWDVAGTDQAPVSCVNVNILLSLDGGQTFNNVLASNVPNNGSSFIISPSAVTSNARIKVECADNIFFNVNESDFEIETNCASIDASINIIENVQNAIWCLNSNGILNFQVSSPNLLITSYQWYHNNVAIAGATSQQLNLNNVQNADGGDYYCEISNGCESIFTNTASVSISTTPIVPIITNDNGQLVSSIPYGNQWYIDGNPIAGATGQYFIPAQLGSITVRSMAGTCSASSVAFVTAIKDLNEIVDINIVPNPSNGLFTIKVANWNKALEIEVKDVLGKTVVVKNNFQNQTQLDLSAFANGLYFAVIKSDNYSASYKLMKK